MHSVYHPPCRIEAATRVGHPLELDWKGWASPHAVYLNPFPGGPDAARHHAPAHGLQPSRGKRHDRTLPPQLEGGGNLAE